DEPRPREQAREAIRSGQIPARPPDRNLTQHDRSGPACPVCGELVKREHLEVEIQFRRQGLGWDRYHLHPRCFAAWEFERITLYRQSSSCAAAGTFWATALGSLAELNWYRREASRVGRARSIR